MYPEDRVLVGVINRKRDLDYARFDHWYRIPQVRFPKGIHTEYLAFYLSRSFAEQNGSIAYYARRTGHELVRRRDLIPEQVNHRRANNLYYKVQLGELREKLPPVLNPTRRPVVFILTTWDRFVVAEAVKDLYSLADHFVDRVQFALQQGGLRPDRIWEAEQISDDGGAQLHIVCQEGEVIATTAAKPPEGRLHLPVEVEAQSIPELIAQIRVRVAALGGPLIASTPLEN